MARRKQTFLKESVVLFGFLNGLFLSLGVNPGATLFAVASNIVVSLTGANGVVLLLLTVAPLALLAFMLYAIHKRAGWLGFVAVGVAFVSGLWLIADPTAAFLLLIGALTLGYVAAR